ncbi:MAG TPA: hypothetical protein VGD37_23720 [Kofleriaceae bacterium]|jgi:hypothetical protein
MATTTSYLSPGVYVEAINLGTSIGRTSSPLTGNLVFHDNEVLLDLADSTAAAPVSVAILSIDDVSVQDNQLSLLTLGRSAAMNARVLGGTVRFQGNRLTEWGGGPISGHVFGIRSIIAIGNQSTAQLLVAPTGSPRTIDQLNLVVG